MRKIFLLLLIFISYEGFAQTAEKTTDLFTITGKVKSERTITVADLRTYPSIELHNINTSCSPKREEKTKSVKVVLFKNLLDSVKFEYDNTHKLGHFYFVFVAADGYKIVFSYNEIFNTEVGNNLYLVTEMDGVKIEAMDSRILLLS
ncbi:MAG: hypothetical protein RLY16_521, partial [Bacteroidota bacterium]